MVLHLSCGGYGIGLDLPATSAAVAEQLSKLREGLERTAPVQISDISCPISNLYPCIQHAELESDAGLEKLNALAERIGSMTSEERRIFSGALDAESVNGLDDVLRIADQLEDYELIEDVICDRDLGGWLVEHDMLGVNFPDAVRPYLDYAAIGAEYYSSHGGAYTMHGYVKRKEASPQLAAEEKSVLRLSLASSRNALTLGLPASEEQLEAAKGALGVQFFDQVGVHGMEFAPDYQTITVPTDGMTIDGANWLARCLRQMDANGMKTYLAALEAEEPVTFTEALDIAVDIDDYELVSGSEGEYGRKYLRRIGADDEVLEAINGYTDFDQLGRDMMKEDGVRQTGYGPLRRLSEPFPPKQEAGPVMT